MTFFEFLEAAGQRGFRQLIETKKDILPFPEPFHNELIELLKQYFFVGGMPEPVRCFADAGDLIEVREIQKEIVNSYLLDFSKHAPTSDIPKLSMIWNSIPAQLARENKKFIFSAIRKSARAREYENTLQWLEDAGLIYRSHQVTTARSPLKGYMNRNNFKVFVLDVGILATMADVAPRSLIEGTSLFSHYKGAFVENYVAQQLKSQKGIDLYYWTSKGKKAELDFLSEFGARLHPLEAKAGVNPKSKSLQSFDNQFNPSVLFRTTLLNLRKDGKICNIPLYALSIFPNTWIS
jgi:predicted AAA+ superfamily ATPase